ncbi:HTH-type transcriptional regulator YjiE [Marinomonas gallaica]|uniref:HTH-type transcriptional regulator YjiE n=1 Tax=Marinomonas gallaica TaxID=1806667 RepID=A0A1C3JMD9_9GAMM|nr:LysR family transcriptional regulator [Marinomonas gallaica]SBT16373.1 HTH-type transcriptional regulator YjiE [Marinomonas gallaica]SBT21421.1 HTH-type transcriptional regulator YjiE [Marinomonas gallaica]
MEIRWLEDFIALARTRHFSRAADEQNVTQPTFSRRIKLLEEEMKVTLVDRNTLPLSLTPAGEIFLQSAELITRQLRDTKTRCLEIKEQEKSQIRFVTTQSLFLGYYREFVEPLGESLGISIDVNMKSSAWAGADFINSMTANESDVMLCFWHPAIGFLKELDEERFEYITIDREILVPCVATDKQKRPIFELPGARKQPIPYIAYDDMTFLAPAVQHHLQRQHDVPQLQILASNIHAASIKAMVKEGFGIGWLPKRLVADSLNYGSLALAGAVNWNVPLEIRLYRARANHNPNLTQFWQSLINQSL